MRQMKGGGVGRGGGGGQRVGTGRTFRNIKERQTELLLTLEPTQTIISAARAWKIIY